MAALLLLAAPAVARANGDPASDYLLVQSVFLPFNAKVEPKASQELAETIKAADGKGLKIKVAVIASRYDLGTAFSLYNKAQEYARFLGLELSFQYRDRLLVVMPNGYGYAIGGKPEKGGAAVLQKLPPPGRGPTKQVQAATAAIRKLAAASGKPLPAAGSGGGSSKTRDRITIAAGLVALAALLAGIVLWRGRASEKPTAGV
ncbi:MAG TPA: hypothetical protein VLB89_02505 [Gaiellaceae bacterium]|nr:hypothetical protein [Gaiellaceae bacterium]